jgi:hypothetical protein
MNPFDIRSALLAKHAQHVVLIHFPIALFITGVAIRTRRSEAQGHVAAALGDGVGLDGDDLGGLVATAARAETPSPATLLLNPA